MLRCLRGIENARFLGGIGHAELVGNKRHIRLAVLLVAVSGWWVWSVASPQEPIYHGKGLDFWLDAVGAMWNPFQGESTLKMRNGESSAKEALAAIGPAAIPFIVAKLDRNDSPWLNKYRELWPGLPRPLKEHLSEPKPIAFSAGAAADAFSTSCDTRAGAHLLLRQLNNRNPAVREAAARALRELDRGLLSAGENGRVFLPLLNDSDPMVRLEAVMAIGRLGPEAADTVPALILLLQSSEEGRHKAENERVFLRGNTALALSDFGPAASNAIPALTNMAVIGDNYQRVAAACALWRITSNADLALPILIQEMPAFSRGMKYLPAGVLQEMGPRAKAALPMLMGELSKHYDDHTSKIIAKTIKSIAPQVPAKAGVN